MFGFEKLDVWQKAIDFANVVYAKTRSFPADERFGLTSQLRRCSVSISSNIAEGSGRGSNADFIRFEAIAYGSLMETVSQTKIALGQGLLAQDSHDEIYQLSEQFARMLSGLKKSLAKNT